MNFHLVNVFTTLDKNSGNQLAVVFPEHKLSDDAMLSITKDFNFSETVFIFDFHDLRIFTPKGELPFAGHPSIGAGWMVQQLTKKTTFTLHTQRGLLNVEANEGGAKLLFPGKPAIRAFDGDLDHILKHCSVKSEDVKADLVRYVSSGPEFIVMPLKNHSALKKATSPITTPDPLKCYFVYQENPETFYVRMFAPVLSVVEDPATGSAACALAGFIRDVLKVPSGKATVFQGKEMNRPSEIMISWDEEAIYLEGSVTKWAEGTL